MILREYTVLDAAGARLPIDRNNPIPTASATGGAIIRLTGTAAGLTNVLIAAPGAGFRIVVRYWIVQNESATASTMILRNGGADAFRYLAQNQGDGLAAFFTAGDDWEITENTAVNLILSAAVSWGYSIGYWTEAV